MRIFLSHFANLADFWPLAVVGLLIFQGLRPHLCPSLGGIGGQKRGSYGNRLATARHIKDFEGSSGGPLR